MSVVGRARAVRTEGVWPRAVTALTETTMVHAALGGPVGSRHFLCAHPRYFGTGREGSQGEVSGRGARRAGVGDRSCSRTTAISYYFPKIFFFFIKKVNLKGSRDIQSCLWITLSLGLSAFREVIQLEMCGVMCYWPFILYHRIEYIKAENVHQIRAGGME